VRFTRLVIVACVLFALVAPLQAFAQSEKFYGDVEGTVFSQILKIPGATVTLYTLSSGGVQSENIHTTYTDSNGFFAFKDVAFDSDKQFQYMVRAEKGNDYSIAWVYALPPDPTSNDSKLAYVPVLSLDLSTPSRNSDLTVTVWSTEGQTTEYSNLETVPGAKLTLYSLDANGNRTMLIDNKITDSNGKYVFNVPYGMYAVSAEKSGSYGEQKSFPVFQQTSTATVITNLPVPTAIPTTVPTATPGTTTPGFEAIVALIALLGGVLYLRRA
jgi:Cna protein B-type domain.